MSASPQKSRQAYASVVPQQSPPPITEAFIWHITSLANRRQ